MFIRKVCIIALFCALFPVTLFAAGKGNDQTHVSMAESVGLIENIYIKLFDSVSDGCWTNAKAVEDRLRYRFESENISVSKEPFAFSSPKNPNMLFSFVGFKNKKSCVVCYTMEVGVTNNYSKYGKDKNEVVVHDFALMWSNGGVFVSANPNDEILKIADSFADQLLASVLSNRKNTNVVSAKKKFFNTYPVITASQFKKFYEEKVKKSK